MNGIKRDQMMNWTVYAMNWSKKSMMIWHQSSALCLSYLKMLWMFQNLSKKSTNQCVWLMIILESMIVRRGIGRWRSSCKRQRGRRSKIKRSLRGKTQTFQALSQTNLSKTQIQTYHTLDNATAALWYLTRLVCFRQPALISQASIGKLQSFLILREKLRTSQAPLVK